MKFIVLAFLVFALMMGGVSLILFSENLWTAKRMPLSARFEPKAILGFFLLFSGVGIVLWIFAPMF